MLRFKTWKLSLFLSFLTEEHVAAMHVCGGAQGRKFPEYRHISLYFLLREEAAGKLIPTGKGGMTRRGSVKEKVGKGHIWSKNLSERRRS